MWKRRVVPAIFGLAIVAALFSLRLADPYPVQAMRDITFDNFQRLSPRPDGDFPVRVVDVDEASLAQIGQWPWPRKILAELVDRLTQMGAAVIVFDMLFPEPDRMSPNRIISSLDSDVAARVKAAGGDVEDYDKVFAAAIARSRTVLGFGVTPQPGPLPNKAKSGFAIVGPDPTPAVPTMPGAVVSLPELMDAATGMGSISLQPGDSIAVVRRLPLLWTDGKQLFPSLALEALRVAMGVSTTVVFGDETGPGYVQSVRVGDLEIPTTPTGALWLHYRRMPDSLYVSAKDILGPDFAAKADSIAGNIVFVGTSATGLLDIRGTPLGINVPGVSIHVQAIEQILSGDFLKRTDWIVALELLFFVVISISIVFLILASGPMLCFVVGAVMAGAIVAASWLGYVKWGLLIDPSYSLVGGFVVYSAMIFFQFVITDADKRRIRGAFGHYVAPALLAQIEKSDRLSLGGEMRDLSIMFSDVRNFTTISEKMEPHALVTMLNTLFGNLGERITEQYGTIDKFIGDAIMAFWNAPIDVPGHPRRACQAALGMRDTLRKLNDGDAFHLKANGNPMSEIAIGIGISTGTALVGNLGLETRFDYSCVGDTVNVASRVEGSCKTVGYDIVVVEATRNQASDFAFLEAGSISLKGKSERERIHILVGGPELAQSEGFKALELAHRAAITELAAGGDADSQIARCEELAAPIEPHLAHFYETLRTRRADFVGQRPQEAIAATGGLAPIPEPAK
ncbi:MAG TPA: adenylate/guanylate cyclase domain-containing protein [Devosiaceae bacterium]